MVEDESGCPEVIPLSLQETHEESCSYIKVDCPNSVHCGKYRRKDLEEHLQECPHYPCQFQDEGTIDDAILF